MAHKLISEIEFQLHGLQHTVAFGDNVFGKVNDLNSTIVVKKKSNLYTHLLSTFCCSCLYKA